MVQTVSNLIPGHRDSVPVVSMQWRKLQLLRYPCILLLIVKDSFRWFDLEVMMLNDSKINISKLHKPSPDHQCIADIDMRMFSVYVSLRLKVKS